MEPVRDPFGAVLVLIRDDPEVAAIAGDRVGANADTAPYVRIRAMPRSMRPFGPNSGNLGLQLAQFIAQCYGRAHNPNGPIESSQLAGAVVAALDRRQHVRASTYLLRINTPDIGETLTDPDTDEPYHTVRIDAYAATQVVT